MSVFLALAEFGQRTTQTLSLGIAKANAMVHMRGAGSLRTGSERDEKHDSGSEAGLTARQITARPRSSHCSSQAQVRGTRGESP